MARVLEEERVSAVMERGSISFLYRPRVGEVAPDQLDDIQRLLIVLEPEDAQLHRVIAIGRKRLPHAAKRERFWGFVDLVLYDRRDLEAALDAQMYKTRTRGIGHLPAARIAGTGSYELVDHGQQHGHLEYTLAHVEERDPVVREMALEPRASFIVTVANPDPTAWGFLEVPPLQYELFDLTEVHVTVPTEFPPKLQERFGGKRFAQLETTEFLDHPGAELVFIPV